jgi:hypothetical protein
MIYIAFQEPTTDKWKRWRNDCLKAKETLSSKVTEGSAIEIDALYRRKIIKEEVFFSKKGPFHGRCAYCECYITDFQHGDIEHFRPKLAVTNEKDEEILIPVKEGVSIPHPGYYWLAFEWTNLLPSCIKCNQPGEANDKKIGKRNRFPVKGSHATNQEGIAGEEPLLINPVEEDPSGHLTVNIENGFMNPKSERGAMCIEIFGLNIRDQLVDDRKKVISHVQYKLLKYLQSTNMAEKAEAMGELIGLYNGACAYTAAARSALKNFFDNASCLQNEME